MTDWDERYRAMDTPWEKGSAAPPLYEVLERVSLESWGGGPVLVPGCGLGHDVRVLAEKGITAVGLDLSEIAIQRARAIPVVGGESFEIGDLLNPEWRVEREFSAIWEHTCFCAIDPSDRQAYAESVAGLLGEGGLLAGVFFLTPFDPGEESPGPPFATSIEELGNLFSPWFDLINGWVPQQAYPGREGREWIGLFRKLSNGSVAGET